MVQDLSWESWGAGGCGAGLDLGTTKGLGLKAGGLSCTPMRGATTGLKVLMVSLVELVLRRMGGSVLAVDLSMTPWMGLRESPELDGVGGPRPLPPPEVWRCSSVSSTTSGACLAELWRSSSRSSFRAVFMVSSMSWRKWREKCDRAFWWEEKGGNAEIIESLLTCAMVSGSRGFPQWWRWTSVKPGYWPEDVERRIGGLSIFLRDSWRLMLFRLPWPARRLRSGLSADMWLWVRRMSLGLKWLMTGEPSSGVPPCPPWPCWEGCTMQWTSPGHAGGRREGGSDLFLCLLSQRRETEGRWWRNVYVKVSSEQIQSFWRSGRLELVRGQRPVIHQNVNAGWKSSSRSGAALYLTLEQRGAMNKCDPRRGANTPSHHSHVHSAVHRVCTLTSTLFHSLHKRPIKAASNPNRCSAYIYD